MSQTQKLAVLLFFGFSLAAIFGLGAISGVSSDEKPSPELMALGKELFLAKDRLKVKYACILCHQQEKAIKKSEALKWGDKLPEVINKYLVEKAKGKALAEDSEEMRALVAYILYEHSV